MADTAETPAAWPGRRVELALLAALLLLAAALRFYQLDSIPPGLTHDEAGHGMDAIAILHGARPIYETVGYGREPLYDYVVAAFMATLGQGYLTLRIVSALAGLLLIVVMHAWVRRAFDVPTALLTSALLATSFWAVSTDRQALRSALLPTLFAASIACTWLALHAQRPRTRWIGYGLAGVWLGACLYTYMAARALPAVFALLWLYLLLFHRPLWRRNWLGLIGVVALGVALSAPMFAYLWSNPGIEARLAQLGGPLDRLFAGDPSEVVNNAVNALGMFTLKGDNLWLYNIPDRPLLDWITGALFCLGLLLAVARFRRVAYAVTLFWLLAGIFPSLLTGVVASNLRSIAAQPVVYLLAALGGIQAVRWLGRWIPSRALRALPLAALVAAISVTTVVDYFGAWAQARDVRVAYHVTLFEMARYLDRAGDGGVPVAISSIYPNRFHDPSAMELTLSRSDVPLRWFTGSFVDMTGAPHASWVFPPGTSLVITQTRAPIDPLFAAAFDRHAERVDSIDLRADDFSPRFDVYRFDGPAALADALTSATRPTQTLDLGHALEWIGYDVRPNSQVVRPGDRVAVITYWRVRSSPEREVVLFTHALADDPSRPVLAQQDALDVPSYYWFPGDAFAQVHRFAIPPDAAPGRYPLEIGAYRRDDGSRLPVTDAQGRAAGDRILIGSIEVQPP